MFLFTFICVLYLFLLHIVAICCHATTQVPTTLCLPTYRVLHRKTYTTIIKKVVCERDQSKHWMYRHIMISSYLLNSEVSSRYQLQYLGQLQDELYFWRTVPVDKLKTIITIKKKFLYRHNMKINLNNEIGLLSFCSIFQVVHLFTK